MKLQNSKTQANLITAFSEETQASVKYTFYADQAKTDGYEQIAEIFTITGENEAKHAKIWFEQLNNGIKNTCENLKDAPRGENYEWSDMYAKYAQTAREEGFDDIAQLFEGVGDIEKSHEERFLTLLENIENEKVFKKDTTVTWHCRNCGHIHQGKSAPAVCPICTHKQAFFEELPENY